MPELEQPSPRERLKALVVVNVDDVAELIRLAACLPAGSPNDVLAVRESARHLARSLALEVSGE